MYWKAVPRILSSSASECLENRHPERTMTRGPWPRRHQHARPWPVARGPPAPARPPVARGPWPARTSTPTHGPWPVARGRHQVLQGSSMENLSSAYQVTTTLMPYRSS